MNAYAAGSDVKVEDLHPERLKLFDRINQASNDSTMLQGNFLKVTVICIIIFWLQSHSFEYPHYWSNQEKVAVYTENHETSSSSLLSYNYT